MVTARMEGLLFDKKGFICRHHYLYHFLTHNSCTEVTRHAHGQTSHSQSANSGTSIAMSNNSESAFHLSMPPQYTCLAETSPTWLSWVHMWTLNFPEKWEKASYNSYVINPQGGLCFRNYGNVPTHYCKLLQVLLRSPQTNGSDFIVSYC